MGDTTLGVFTRHKDACKAAYLNSGLFGVNIGEELLSSAMAGETYCNINVSGAAERHAVIKFCQLRGFCAEPHLQKPLQIVKVSGWAE